MAEIISDEILNDSDKNNSNSNSTSNNSNNHMDIEQQTHEKIMRLIEKNAADAVRGSIGRLSVKQLALIVADSDGVQRNDARSAVRIELAKRLSADDGWRHATPHMGDEEQHSLYVKSTPERTLGIEVGAAVAKAGAVTRETGIGLYLRCEHLQSTKTVDPNNGQLV